MRQIIHLIAFLLLIFTVGTQGFWVSNQGGARNGESLKGKSEDKGEDGGSGTSCFPHMFNPGCFLNRFVPWSVVCRNDNLRWKQCEILRRTDTAKGAFPVYDLSHDDDDDDGGGDDDAVKEHVEPRNVNRPFKVFQAVPSDKEEEEEDENAGAGNGQSQESPSKMDNAGEPQGTNMASPETEKMGESDDNRQTVKGRNAATKHQGHSNDPEDVEELSPKQGDDNEKEKAEEAKKEEEGEFEDAQKAEEEMELSSKQEEEEEDGEEREEDGESRFGVLEAAFERMLSKLERVGGGDDDGNES